MTKQMNNNKTIKKILLGNFTSGPQNHQKKQKISKNKKLAYGRRKMS